MRMSRQFIGATLSLALILQLLFVGEIHVHAETVTGHTVSNAAAWLNSSFTTSQTDNTHPQGTQGSVASSLLLGYYDLNHNTSILSGSTASINTAYNYLVQQTLFGLNGKSYPKDDAQAINSLLSVNLANVSFGARAYTAAFSDTAAMYKILENKPVVLYTQDTAVVAYAFQSTENGQTFTVHTGTMNGTTPVNSTTMSGNSFEWMLWIDTVAQHAHQMEYVDFSLTDHILTCTHEHCAVVQSQPHTYALSFSGQLHEYTCPCGFYLAKPTHDCRTSYCSLCQESTSHDAPAATCTEGSVCTYCGNTAQQPLGHQEVDVSNENGHGKNCSRCGISLSFEAHTPSAQYHWNANQHYQKCSECDWSLQYANHTLVYVSSNASSHLQKCSVCNYETSFDHDKLYTQTETTHTEYCSHCSYVGSPVTHNWSGYQSNGSNHWRTCTTCGYVSSTTGHTWSSYHSNGSGHWRTCTVCNYQSASSGHTMSWSHDTSYHYYRCSVCNYQQTSGSHNMSRNCTQAWCTTCSYTNWDGYGHDYGSDGYCSCGARDPNYTPHTHNYTWQCEYYGPSGTYCRHEWYQCSCGDTYGHSYYDHMYLGGSCIECDSLRRSLVLTNKQGAQIVPISKSEEDEESDT